MHFQRWHFLGIPTCRPKSAGTRRPRHGNPELTSRLFDNRIQSMELSRGCQVEEPRIFVPWDIGEEAFQKIFPELHSRLVTAGLLYRSLHFARRFTS